MSDDEEQEQRQREEDEAQHRRNLALTALLLFGGSKTSSDSPSTYSGGASISPQSAWGCLAVIGIIAVIGYFATQKNETYVQPVAGLSAQHDYSRPTPREPQAPVSEYSRIHGLFVDAMAALRRGDCNAAKLSYSEAEGAVRESGLLEASGAKARRQRAAIHRYEERYAEAEQQCSSAQESATQATPSDQENPSRPAQDSQKKDVIDQWVNKGK